MRNAFGISLLAFSVVALVSIFGAGCDSRPVPPSAPDETPPSQDEPQTPPQTVPEPAPCAFGIAVDLGLGTSPLIAGSNLGFATVRTEMLVPSEFNHVHTTMLSSEGDVTAKEDGVLSFVDPIPLRLTATRDGFVFQASSREMIDDPLENFWFLGPFSVRRAPHRLNVAIKAARVAEGSVDRAIWFQGGSAHAHQELSAGQFVSGVLNKTDEYPWGVSEQASVSNAVAIGDSIGFGMVVTDKTTDSSRAMLVIAKSDGVYTSVITERPLNSWGIWIRRVLNVNGRFLVLWTEHPLHMPGGYNGPFHNLTSIPADGTSDGVASDTVPIHHYQAKFRYHSNLDMAWNGKDLGVLTDGTSTYPHEFHRMGLDGKVTETLSVPIALTKGRIHQPSVAASNGTFGLVASEGERSKFMTVNCR